MYALNANAEGTGEHVGVIVVSDEEGIAELEASEKRKFSEKEIEARLRTEVKQQVAALADYKHPRRIRIRWEEFNKTSTGKIKRYLYAMNEAVVESRAGAPNLQPQFPGAGRHGSARSKAHDCLRAAAADRVSGSLAD